MKPSSIGILGGLGAIASARFHLDLVEAWALAHDAKTDDNFPSMVHISQPLGLTETGLTDATSPKSVHAVLTLFAALDIQWVAVICNSIIPLLPTEEENPYILTPVLACRQALKGVKSAWLLASDSTIRDRVYQDAYPDIEWRLPPVSMTPAIQQSICNRDFQIALDITETDVIVLGCTELSTCKSCVSHLHPARVISPTDEMIRFLCNTNP